MSRILPAHVVESLRSYVNHSVNVFGVDCDLYIPEESVLRSKDKDIYDEQSGIDTVGAKFNHYFTKVWINFNSKKSILRRLGLFLEKEPEMEAYFSLELPIVRSSYFRINVLYANPPLFKENEFEVVDNLVPSLHDAIIVNVWSIAPLRRKVVSNSSNMRV